MTKNHNKKNIKRCIISGKNIENQEVLLPEYAVEYVKKQGNFVIPISQLKMKNITLGFILLLMIIGVQSVSGLDLNYANELKLKSDIQFVDCLHITGSNADLCNISEFNFTNFINSSDFWDNRNTPADIFGSAINNNLNWINWSVSSNGTLAFNSSLSNYLLKSGDTAIGTYFFKNNAQTLNLLELDGSLNRVKIKGELYVNTDKFYVNSGITRTGIGTASPNTILTILGDPIGGSPYISTIYSKPVSDGESGGFTLNTTLTSSDRLWTFLAGTGGGSPNTNFRIWDSTAGADRLNINPSGFVGIGTISPADRLTIFGDVNISGCYQLYNGTTIGGSCISDIRTKKNLSNYSINLNNLLSLSPKEFNYKDTKIFAGTRIYYECNNGSSPYSSPTGNKNEVCIERTEEIYYDFPAGTQKGFIADEVEQYYPEFVSLDEFGFKKVTYGFNWVFELWKQNQEQQKQINLLKSELCFFNSLLSWCKK